MTRGRVTPLSSRFMAVGDREVAEARKLRRKGPKPVSLPRLAFLADKKDADG